MTLKETLIRRMAREREKDVGETAVADPAPTVPKLPSKTSLLIGMLTRKSGATLEQMVEATGWQPHTTRAALTGLRKKGSDVTSEKVEGVRVYRLAKGAEPV